MSNSDRYAGTDVERWRIHDIHEYGVDTRHFIIYLQGVEDNPYDDSHEPGVEYRMANRLIKNLDILTGIDAERPITISMKTCGGSWEEGIAIHDAILATPNPITIINYTHARSMSSLILQAANKRVMMPHSTFMYHEGTYETSGTVKQVKTSIKFSAHSEQQMLEIYIDALKRSPGMANKWSRTRIRNMLIKEMNDKEEVYMTPKETIEWGFADAVFTDWASVTEYSEQQLRRK